MELPVKGGVKKMKQGKMIYYSINSLFDMCLTFTTISITLAEEQAAQPPAAAAPAAPAAAAPAAPLKVDSGDTAWLLTSSALVLLMTAPGLALFYCGMVRRKNVLGTMMHSFVILCLISVQWVLYGYSLSFGPDHGHIIGGLEWFGLNGVGLEPNGDYGPTVP